VDEVGGYALVAAAVFGINLLPAFGPPTWAVLVLFTLHGDYVEPVLVLVGALAAAGGRLLLAHGTRRLRRFVPDKQRDNLEAAGELLTRRRTRSVAGLALFAVSPVPSAQLFEAAGLMTVRLLPLTAAFFVGRTVSYGLYVGGAKTLSETDTGEVLLSSLTSPWGVAIQVAMLVGLVLLARVDWRGRFARHHTE
jgi:membrane protein YqaA with SNARE-associated domain